MFSYLIISSSKSYINLYFCTGLIEFEMEDPNVPGHAVIKLRSKQLVDAQVSEFDVPDTKK